MVPYPPCIPVLVALRAAPSRVPLPPAQLPPPFLLTDGPLALPLPPPAAPQCGHSKVSATLDGQAVKGVVVDQPPNGKDQNAWLLRATDLDCGTWDESRTADLCVYVDASNANCKTIDDLFPEDSYKLALWGKDYHTGGDHDCCPGGLRHGALTHKLVLLAFLAEQPVRQYAACP